VVVAQLRYRVLGPVEALVAGEPAALAGARQRTLLAALLLRAGQVVATETLIELVWGQTPPKTVVTALHGLVSRLRRALDAGDGASSPLVLRAPGYVLEVAPDALDLWECERLADEGGRALADGDAERATASFSRALALWRGPALGGATAGTLATLEAPRLEELRLVCVEGRAEAELTAGRHAELAPELHSLVAEHPFRERLRAQQMLALYRLGRRADALESYRTARNRFVAQLGLEPGPALRDLERAILADDPALRLADVPQTPAPAPGPEQLPPDVADFTGREPILNQVRELLGGGSAPASGGAPAVVALSGKPGVGKTALAVHIAHSVRERFPDGQLFVSLRGIQDDRVDPADVLEEWLRALGGAPGQIPTELDARTRSYRARLSGRRMLIVLDDAADEAQVRPLLPATGESAVLCTSRRPLAGLEGAQFLAAEPLPDDEAFDLLQRIAGAERVAEEPDAARLIVARCGYLPLAVRVAGGRLTQRDHWSLADLADRLDDAGRRLDELRVGDLEVRASVDLSYRALAPGDQRALRLLGLLDGPSFAGWLAAAVLDASLAETDATLERLIDQQLIDVAGQDRAGQLRYRFHDVLADFVRERLAEEPTDTRRAGLKRALGACLEHTERLATTIASVVPVAGIRRARRWAPTDQAIEPHDQAAAYRWFETERATLVRIVERAADEPGLESWELAANVGCAFEQSLRLRDWYRVLDAGRRAAERDDDRAGRAISQRGLGLYYMERGDLERARRSLETALHELGGLDEPEEHAAALVGLADTRWCQGDPAPAIELLEPALEMLRALGLTDREVVAVTVLGNAYATLGQLGTAQRLLREARDLSRRLGDLRGESYAWNGLGWILLEGGYPDVAAECYTRAQQLAEQSSDDLDVAARFGFSYARRDQGRLDEAEREFRAMYATAHEREFMRGQVYALYGIGTTEHRRRRLTDAADDLQRAVTVSEQMGDERCRALNLTALGEVRLDQGRDEDASSLFRAAAEIAGARHLLGIEADARDGLVRSLAAAGADASDESARAAQLRARIAADPPSPAL
jgi:DNA-binding SARP family transcriptional activator/Tfp pilus assembly protein PilF